MMQISKHLRFKFPFFHSSRNDYLFSPAAPLMYHGRYAFYQALALLGLKKNDRVLLPSYHCLSMIVPVLHYGCKVSFYKISDDLQTTVNHIENAITNDTKAVFLVHYFGLFQKQIEEIKDYLLSKDIFLIEDCAHVIPLRHQKAGTIGDISIFSPRKFLPLIDGAFLRINNPKVTKSPILKNLPLLRELKVVKNTFEQHLNASKYEKLKHYYLIIDKNINNSRKILKPPPIQNHTRRRVSTIPVEFDMNLANKRCSCLARYILSRANFETIYEKRKRAFKYFYDELYIGHGLKPPAFLNSGGSECAFGFPILAKNKRDVIFELKKRNIQTFTFGEELHKHVVRQGNLVDERLFSQLFFMPIHQDLNFDELRYISRNLKEILRIGQIH